MQKMSQAVNPLPTQDLSDMIRSAMAETLNERVRRRLKEEKERRDLSERDLSGILNWSQSRVAQKLGGRTPITLDELEALCFGLSLLPSEAVRDRGLEFCAEMTPTELRALEALRSATEATRGAILTLLHVKSTTALPERFAGPLKDKHVKRR